MHPLSAASPPPIPTELRRTLRQAALQRNLRTAAVLGLAASGALLSTPWLAATAGSTFLALTLWRYRQQRQPGPTGDQPVFTPKH